MQKVDSHVSSGATRWATGWSTGPGGPAGKAASCLLSEPERFDLKISKIRISIFIFPHMGLNKLFD